MTMILAMKIHFNNNPSTNNTKVATQPKAIYCEHRAILPELSTNGINRYNPGISHYSLEMSCIQPYRHFIYFCRVKEKH